jgi:hypothetical protein
MQDKASDKSPSDKPSKATELDDGALETVVGGCQISPGGITIPSGPSTGGTSPPIEGGGGLGGKGTSTQEPTILRFPK